MPYLAQRTAPDGTIYEEEIPTPEEEALLAAGGSPSIYEGTEPVPTPIVAPNPASDQSIANPAALVTPAVAPPPAYDYAAAEPYGTSAYAIDAGGDSATLRSQAAYAPPPLAALPEPRYTSAAAEPYGVSDRAIHAGGDSATLRSQEAYGPAPSSTELPSPSIYEGTEPVPTPNFTAYPEVGTPYTPLQRRTSYPEPDGPPYTPLQPRPRRNTGGKGTLRIPVSEAGPTADVLTPLAQARDEGGRPDTIGRTLGRFAGLDPDDPNVDMLAQLSRNLLRYDPSQPQGIWDQTYRNLSDAVGDALGTTVRDAGGLVRDAALLPADLARGAQILIGNPLGALRQGAEYSSQGPKVRANLAGAAREVLGPLGWTPRQVQSTANPVIPALMDTASDVAARLPNPAEWARQLNREDQALQARGLGATNPIAATGRTLSDAIDFLGWEDALASAAQRGRGAFLAANVDRDALADTARVGLQDLRAIDIPTPSLPAVGVAPGPVPVPNVPSRPSFDVNLPEVPRPNVDIRGMAQATEQRARGVMLGALLRGDDVDDVIRGGLQQLRSVDLPTPTLPALPDAGISAPDVPELDIPRPDVSLPQIGLPDIDLSGALHPPEQPVPQAGLGDALVDAARQAAQRVRTIDVPSVSLPDVSLPSVGLPDLGGGPRTTHAATRPATTLDPETAAGWAGMDTGAVDAMAKNSKPDFLAGTEPRTVTLPDGSTRQVIAVKGMDDAKGNPYIVGVVKDGAMTPVGRDTPQPALKDLLATADEATADATPAATVPEPAASTTATGTASGGTLEDVAIPTPAGTGGGSSRSSGGDYSPRSSGGGSWERGSYDRDYGDGYDREFAADRFASRRRRRRRGGDQGGGGTQFWEGFPYGRPPSPIRTNVLAALNEAFFEAFPDSTGRRR